MRGPGELTASLALGGILKEASQAVERKGACSGRARLADLSTVVSKKSFWAPRDSEQEGTPTADWAKGWEVW